MKVSFAWNSVWEHNLCLLSVRNLTQKIVCFIFQEKQHYFYELNKTHSVHMRLTVVLDTLEELPFQWTVCLEMKPRKTLVLKIFASSISFFKKPLKKSFSSFFNMVYEFCLWWFLRNIFINRIVKDASQLYNLTQCPEFYCVFKDCLHFYTHLYT